MHFFVKNSLLFKKISYIVDLQCYVSIKIKKYRLIFTSILN